MHEIVIFKLWPVTLAQRLCFQIQITVGLWSKHIDICMFQSYSFKYKTICLNIYCFINSDELNVVVLELKEDGGKISLNVSDNQVCL